MFTIRLSEPISVHFTGIGGISMSGLAHILMDKGFKVSGSDTRASDITRELEARGALIGLKQDGSSIPDDTGVLVYTAAVRPDNPELAEARRRGIPLLTRAQLLGQLMTFYDIPVAISGTHGKTTTTSMLSQILLEADTDPTLSIGGILPSIGGNTRVGAGPHFVTEACEYTDSFLSFFPKVAVILNIEEDHLDYFSGLDAIRNSFRRFAGLLPHDGTLVINGSIPRLKDIISDTGARVVTYGEDPSFDYYYTDYHTDDEGLPSFNINIRSNGGQYPISLRVPGRHNAMNSLAAFALSECLGISNDAALKGLSVFGGSERRFEFKGSFEGISVIDDYAHHPTEIASTLSAAADVPHESLWVVFQPHTYTRTKAFMKDFASALSLADHCILADIYAARETDDLGISSQTLADTMDRMGHKALCIHSFEDICTYLKNNCHQGDLVITMGAGDVVKIGDMLLQK